jgi:DNA polymerase-3 subunit delta'
MDIGKSTVAIDFAGILLCGEKEDGLCCTKCQSCRLFLNGANPDFDIIEAVGASIGVDEIRRLQKDILIAPMYSHKKVYLIKEAQKMTAQAQNCILKTLEDPPDNAIIILTTSNYSALLETVRSRLFKYEFTHTYQYNETKQAVLGSIPLDELVVIRDKSISVLFDIRKLDLANVFSMFSFFETNKKNIDLILDTMLLFYRDILIFKKTDVESMLINSDKKDSIIRSATDIGSETLINNIEAIETAKYGLEQNANFQITIEVMLLNLR